MELDMELKKLKRFNLIMGAFHFIQGILMLFLATVNVNEKVYQLTF